MKTLLEVSTLSRKPLVHLLGLFFLFFYWNTMWNNIFHLIEDKCINRRKKKVSPNRPWLVFSESLSPNQENQWFSWSDCFFFLFYSNTLWNNIFHLIEDKCINRRRKNKPEQVLASFSDFFQWWPDGKQDQIARATAKCITFLETRRRVGFNDTSPHQLGARV